MNYMCFTCVLPHALLWIWKIYVWRLKTRNDYNKSLSSVYRIAQNKRNDMHRNFSKVEKWCLSSFVLFLDRNKKRHFVIICQDCLNLTIAKSTCSISFQLYISEYYNSPKLHNISVQTFTHESFRNTIFFLSFRILANHRL